jgi:N-acyl-D-amino-acid deacylase
LNKDSNQAGISPATRIGCPRRKADVVVFDPETVRDLATFDDPNRLSEGMEYVLINGVPVIENGKMTGALPGKVLRGAGYVP